MKKLKYMLFIFLMCYVSITPVLAKEELMKCEYNKLYINAEKNQYIKYRVTLYDDDTVKHEFVPSDSSNYKKGSNNHNNVGVFNESGKRAGTMTGLEDNFSASEMQKYYQKGVCPYALFSNTTSSLADRKITPVDTSDASKYAADSLLTIISTKTNEYVKASENNENNDNDSISCVYGVKYSNIKVNCVATQSSLTCTSELSVMKNSLKLTDFKKNNDLVCLSTIAVDINNSGVITDITLSGGTDTLKLDEKASSGDISGDPVEEDPTPTNDYENDERYKEAKADADKYCDEMNFEYQDDAKCAEAKEKMEEIKNEYLYSPPSEDDGNDGAFDIHTFCTGKVQGVFTTIGWIFFVLKIVVPIILIIFGIIDFSKAVIASKDDEIKKAGKSMAIRAIAGIVIFFVPSLLGFIVSIIDDDNVYKGTFLDCTKCMLEPNNNACSSLGGN